MGLSRYVSRLLIFSVSCFLRCCLMHLVARIMESIFNAALRALSSTSKTKVKTDIINKFLFTDDCALNATIKGNMQKVLTSSQWPVTILA